MKKNDRNPRSFPVDQSLPRLACHNCHQNISVSGFDSFSDASRSGMQGSMMNGSGNVMDASLMDQSFVVLSNQRNQVTGGVPRRPRTGTMHHQPDSNHSHKYMEESYIVLPPLAASVYKTDFGPDVNVTQSLSSEGGTGSVFSSKLKVLKRALDVATSQTQVDQPLCLECVGVLSDNIDMEVEDVKRDIDAYESCLKELEGEEYVVLRESDFVKEKLKVEEEERKLMEEIKETEKQLAQVNATLKELEVKLGRFKELEERYWHKFNNFQFRLTTYQSERDAVLAKIEVSQAHVELLNKTNLLSDAFPITHDTEFGMINNFRLGRLPKILVEWDEINAAWGQACLLLHTVCQHFRPKFQYRIKILPMGSYPRIMDSSNNVYELFGPVNLFWSSRYDKAMTLFLACLKDFADFAIMMERESNLSGDSWFYLPYEIDNDKVSGYSITQSFNKQEHWTKALKYTLCNLKWCLQWSVCNSKTFRPMSSAATSRPGFPPLHMKHGGNSMSKNSTKAV